MRSWAFLTSPVDESSCAMLDEWKIFWEWRDLPRRYGTFIKREKLFGMILPKGLVAGGGGGGLASSPTRIPKWCARSRPARARLPSRW